MNKRSTTFLLGLLLAAAPARATWSIVAVDYQTGEIGIAGASCTYDVQGIGEVVPGRGVVVVQAMSNGAARDRGVQLLREGTAPEQIVAAMRDERFDPEHQQYGVVVIDDDRAPCTYSGTGISGWSGAATGSGVAALGNTLPDERVVTAALAAFRAAEAKGQSLSERLTAALVAGGAAGGDKRCGEQRARSAFVTVYKPDDDPRTPYLHLGVYGIEKGGPPAVERVAEEFELWRRHGTERKSTRVYIVP